MRDLLPRFVVLGRNSIAPGYVFDLEAPLVVIFGPTGSGKSVLLSCLRYALGGPEPEDAKARDAWVICQPREPSDAHLIYDALVGPAFERRLHVAVGEVVRRWIVMRSEVPPVYGSISEDDEPIGSPLDEARLSNEMPDDPPRPG